MILSTLQLQERASNCSFLRDAVIVARCATWMIRRRTLLIGVNSQNANASGLVLIWSKDFISKGSTFDLFVFWHVYIDLCRLSRVGLKCFYLPIVPLARKHQIIRRRFSRCLLLGFTTFPLFIMFTWQILFWGDHWEWLELIPLSLFFFSFFVIFFFFKFFSFFPQR